MKRSIAGDMFPDSPEPLEIDLSSEVVVEADDDSSSSEAKRSRASNEEDDNDAGLDEILDALNVAGPATAAAAGVGDVAAYSGVVRTGLPKRNDPVTVRRIYDVAEQHFTENQHTGHIVFALKGSVKAAWPVCTLTMREGTADHTLVSNGERKFLAVQFPPFTEASAQPVYFLYKKMHELTHALKLSEAGLHKLVEASATIYKYLEKIENFTLAFGQGLPERPEPIVLEEVDQSTRIILQVDDVDTRRKSYKLTPNISIRVNKKSRDGTKWYPDRSGVTISPANFFFLIEGTIKTFVYQLKEIISDFREVYAENRLHTSNLANKASARMMPLMN